MEVIARQIETKQVDRKFTDQFMIDEDYNVPDSKRDVERIVADKGIVRIDEVKPVENYLRVQGKIEFRVLYRAEGYDPNFSCLEGKIPFVEMVYVQDKTQSDLAIQQTKVDLHVQLIHSRKLRIKAMVELELESESSRTEDIPIDVSAKNSIYKKQRRLELLKLNTSKKDMYRIKEEITLPSTKETIDTILWEDIENRRLDTRLAVGELQIDGELLVFCLYESPDGKVDWIEQTIPYIGRVECYDVDETMYHHAQAHLEDVHIDVRADEDGETRVIGIEGTLQLRIIVYEEEQEDILEDVYSLEEHCILETKPVEYEQLILQNHSKCKVMERVSIPELHNEVLQICHSGGAIQIDRMIVREDGIMAEGALYISFLFIKSDDSMPFDTWNGMVPFSHLIECSRAQMDMKYHISATMEQLSITLQGGDEVEVKASLAFHGLFKKTEKMEMIQNINTEPISMEEIENRPSVIGHIVREHDEIWDLAKKYHTSVEAIRTMNELTGEKLKEGARLLIFRENMSIL